MKVVYRKRFLKDLAGIPSNHRQRIETFVFEELPSAESLEATGRFERLTARPHFYKVRFGVYRLGARAEAGQVTLERVLHRKDIYRKFP